VAQVAFGTLFLACLLFIALQWNHGAVERRSDFHHGEYLVGPWYLGLAGFCGPVVHVRPDGGRRLVEEAPIGFMAMRVGLVATLAASAALAFLAMRRDRTALAAGVVATWWAASGPLQWAGAWQKVFHDGPIYALYGYPVREGRPWLLALLIAGVAMVVGWWLVARCRRRGRSPLVVVTCLTVGLGLLA
jgi:hypothetical protein